MDVTKKTDDLGILTGNSTIKNALFWICLLLLLALAGLAILLGRGGWSNEALILSLGIIPITLALELNRRNFPQAAGGLIAITLMVVITVVATIGEGIYDIGVMAYPAILITAALVLRRNTTIYLAVFVVACIAWLIFGDIRDWYQPHYPHQSPASDFIIASVILIITATAVQFLSNTIRNNINAIRHELEERNKVAKALKDAEELYRNLVEKTSVITYRDMPDVEGRTIYISPQIEKILGHTQREWLENPTFWMTITHPDDLPMVLNVIKEYLATGENAKCEYRVQSKDGHWVWFQDESMVIKDENGKPEFIHGVWIDITERKHAETKVKQREAILSAVANTAQHLLRSSNWRNEMDAILKLLGEATGASHVYIFENHAGADGIMLSSIRYEWTAVGMTPELNNPIYQDTSLIPTVPGLEDWYLNLTAGKPFYGGQQQYPRYWKKVFEPQGLKTLLDVPIYVQNDFWGIIGFDDYNEEMPWSQAEIDALMAAAGNLGAVISRQRFDEALRASEEKFELAFHHTFVPMVISRVDNQVILDANEAFCKGTGYSREEALGHTSIDLNLWVNTEDQLRHQETLKQRGFDEEFKAEFRRKSGEIGVALISAVAFHLGNDLCLLHTLYDISKIDELLKELKAKNDELQSFTYTVSHDLRAPLITISGFLGYLEEDARKGNLDRVLRDTQRIKDAVLKMERLLSELLELSRIGRLMNPPQDVSFGDIVQEALQTVRGRLDLNKVEVISGANFPVVYGDRIRLAEVVQNLVDNAAKFMGVQEKPQIEIGTQNIDGNTVFFVRDNGIGIEPEYHEKVFGLFNKLDANSEGTGIGLALVKRIVEVHGGKIWVESNGQNQGTTFYFTLADRS